MKFKSKIGCLTITLTLALLPVAGTNAAQTRLVSADKNGAPAGGYYWIDPNYMEMPTLSTNGRYIAFTGMVSNFLSVPYASANHNFRSDIFWRDVYTNTTKVLSNVNELDDSNLSINDSRPLISSNGRFVVFHRFIKSLLLDSVEQLLISDTKTGQTSVVASSSLFWGGPNGLSANGNLVLFTSADNKLVKRDTNGGIFRQRDIFVRDIKAQTTQLISINHTKTDSANGASYEPQFSANGQVVLFFSTASDLIADGDANDVNENCFVRHLKTGKIHLIKGGRFSRPVTLSANGRTVVFNSDDKTLVTHDINGDQDVFVHDVTTNKTTLVSVNKTGTGSGNGGSTFLTASANGRFVLFSSLASNLVDNVKSGIFLHDIATHKTKYIMPIMSDAVNKTMVLSADGRYMSFSSTASNLVRHDNNKKEDVFVKDLRTGLTQLISTNQTESASGNGSSTYPILSADGRVVVFLSDADNLIPNDRNQTPDIFARQFR